MEKSLFASCESIVGQRRYQICTELENEMHDFKRNIFCIEQFLSRKKIFFETTKMRIRNNRVLNYNKKLKKHELN